MNQAKKILVVEDNPDFLEVVCTFLSSHYSQIRTAENVHIASTILHDWHPDVVLADFHLPDAKATELLEDNMDDTPGKFVIMTGDLRQRDSLEDRRDIDRVLYKPFHLADLLAAIANGGHARP